MRAVIIEDEKPASDYLKFLFNKFQPEFEVVAVIDTVEKAINWFSLHQADLAIMDIHLGDDNSFKIFERVQLNIPVIFTTAYNEYALKAFKVNSIDYLLKPFTEDEFNYALNKFLNGKREEDQLNINRLLEFMQKKTEYQSRFMVVFRQKLIAIQVSSIAYFRVENRYVTIHTKEGGKYLLEKSLDTIGNVLDPALFFRANRQTIIQFDAIKTIHVWSKSRIRVEMQPAHDFDIIISAEKATEFKQWLGK